MAAQRQLLVGIYQIIRELPILKEKIIFLEQPVGALPFHKEEEK
jgi:hypothetical protein